MVAYTPKYNIPYPTNTDPVGAGVFQQMAERIEQTLANASMPVAEANLQIVGPYSATNYLARTSAGTFVELASVTIPNPGWRYRLVVFGRWEARTQTPGSRAEIVAHVGSSAGPRVGRGYGMDSTAFHHHTVTPEAHTTPASAPSFTGSQIVRAYLARGFGGSTVEATAFGAALVVYVVRA